MASVLETYQFMREDLLAGRVVIVDGIDGTGKTTLIRNFQEWVNTLPESDRPKDLLTLAAAPKEGHRRDVLTKAIAKQLRGPVLNAELNHVHDDFMTEIMARWMDDHNVICDRGPFSMCLNVSDLQLPQDDNQIFVRTAIGQVVARYDAMLPVTHYIIMPEDLEAWQTRLQSRGLEHDDKWVLDNHHAILTMYGIAIAEARRCPYTHRLKKTRVRVLDLNHCITAR